MKDNNETRPPIDAASREGTGILGTFQIHCSSKDADLAFPQSDDSFSIHDRNSLTSISGTQFTHARFIEPISMMLTISAAILANRLLHTWLADKTQGVLIDARQSPALISRLSGIPAGFMVVIGVDGKTEKYDTATTSAESLSAILQKFAAVGDTAK